jgi:signal transduction histidine kinase
MLRPGTRALRRQLATAQLVAEASMLMINCRGGNPACLIERMLAELGRQMRTQRAYLVLDDEPDRMAAWQEEGAECPQGWPLRVLSLPLRPGPAQDGVTAIADVRRLPDGVTRQALLAAGVHGWICMSLERPGGVKGLIGFDALAPIEAAELPCRTLLRVAADAVANALEREALERDRARLMERTERVRRVQTIGILTSGIAHNFNNVIGSILGYTQFAVEEAPAGTRLARYLGEIRRAADGGRDLIEGILAFGNQSKGARPIRVSDLLAETGSLLCAALPSSVELAMTDTSPGLAVFGDPVQLQQVLINLCSNASQAMDGKGCVRVTVDLQVLADPRSLTQGNLPAGRYVRFCVRDAGAGFDRSVAARLFEPFFTTRHAGTGLGLATVREIVCDHDGAMHVESTPGHGSTFEVWLPAEPGMPEAAEGDQPIGDGRAVLLIDSGPEELLRAEESVAASGYEPVGFGSREDALRAIQASPARFDAAVIGCAWPGPDELRFARLLRELLPGRPILLAADIVPEIGGMLLSERDAGLLHRPIDRREMARALDPLLRPVPSPADQ